MHANGRICQYDGAQNTWYQEHRLNSALVGGLLSLAGSGTHLDGGAQGDADCQVHFVLGGHEHCGDVLTGIASDGQHDEPEESAFDAGPCADLLNRAGQEPANPKHGPYQASSSIIARLDLKTMFDPVISQIICVNIRIPCDLDLAAGD